MTIQIGLHGGGRFTVTDDSCDVSQITPEVIAYGLSHVTRFGGQAGPYSVAEHSVRMFDWALADGQDKAVLRAILLHDAPECLGEGDHQRFVKRAFFGDGVKKFANMVTSALWNQFAPAGRPWSWDAVHDTLKFYDDWIGCLEARAFGFPHEPIPDWLNCSYAPNPRYLGQSSQGEAERGFLERWHACE